MSTQPTAARWTLRAAILGIIVVVVGIVIFHPTPLLSNAPGAAATNTSRDSVQAEATYRDIEKTMGKVPGFLKQFPKAGLPGAWQEIKALEFSDRTALSPKVKSLISLAVAAQIPCQYCIWADTRDAKQAGATDEEIHEAVAISALARHWSTIFNGYQIDMMTFKKELGDNGADGAR